MTERDMLLSYLNGQRKHIVGILEGLDDDALRKPVLPSGWNCLGLVQHLALDVERFWFRGITAGEQAVIDKHFEGNDDAWQVGPDVSASAVLASYREEIERANAIIAATELDTAPAWWPKELFGDSSIENLREIILHVMVETATHAGHLDAVRELIDGKRWLVLTE